MTRNCGLILICLLAWEALYRLKLLNPIVFASPSLVIKAAWDHSGEFADAFRTTLVEIFIAIAISWTGGVIFGAAAGSMRLLGRIASPLLSALIAIPFVILYPVLMAWFGIGSESKIIFGVLLGIFPIALNTAIGVQAIEQGYVRMAHAMGASNFQTVARVMTPLAIPAVISGLRLGTSLIVAGVILTEMLASTGGLGYLISYHQAMFDTGDVMLGILLGVVVASAANWALTRLERRFSGWHLLQQQQADQN